MSEIVLVTLSGPDRPGVTSSITEALAQYGVNILDVGQAVIHNNLSLGLLIEIPVKKESAPILKEVLFLAHKLGMAAKFNPVETQEYEDWVNEQGKDRYIVTLLARRITASQLSKVTQVIAANKLNIDNISRLSGRVALNKEKGESKACVEFSVRGQPEDPDAMKGAFLAIANELNVDIGFQQDNAFRRNRRLVVFDMDSTLIDCEIIDELAVKAGVGEKVSRITELAMQGKLDFDESFRQRLALLKGLPESELKGIARNLRLTEGAENLVSTLKALGYKTAILSGGFTFFGKKIQQNLGIDYIYANELEIIDGKVTGEVSGEIVNGSRKAQLLKSIAENEGISLQQVIAVGDGANDLPMLSVAGLGIAFRAKPLVKESADHSITTLGLDGILYLIGVRDRECVDLSTLKES